MSPYFLEFHEDWHYYFGKLDNSVKKQIMKKVMQLQNPLPARHLKFGLDFYVEDVGQYRICYKIDETRQAKVFYFAGTHKEYEKWLGMLG